MGVDMSLLSHLVPLNPNLPRLLLCADLGLELNHLVAHLLPLDLKLLLYRLLLNLVLVQTPLHIHFVFALQVQLCLE